MTKMMSIKILNVNKEVATPDNYEVDATPALINEVEYPYIYQDHQISDEEFENAIDTLITHCMQRQLHTITIDLSIKNKIEEQKTKPLELTIEDIEHMFGRKVVIVKSKPEEGCEDCGDKQ